jgi:hypothetical protein
MANLSAHVQKTLRMKPEVTRIFDDLENWLDYCRFNMIAFNPSDLYRSLEYRNFQRGQEYLERKARRENRAPRQDY